MKTKAEGEVSSKPSVERRRPSMRRISSRLWRVRVKGEW